jgi:hypothetical protein
VPDLRPGGSSGAVAVLQAAAAAEDAAPDPRLGGGSGAAAAAATAAAVHLMRVCRLAEVVVCERLGGTAALCRESRLGRRRQAVRRRAAIAVAVAEIAAGAVAWTCLPRRWAAGDPGCGGGPRPSGGPVAAACAVAPPPAP